MSMFFSGWCAKAWTARTGPACWSWWSSTPCLKEPFICYLFSHGFSNFVDFQFYLGFFNIFWGLCFEYRILLYFWNLINFWFNSLYLNFFLKSFLSRLDDLIHPSILSRKLILLFSSQFRSFQNKCLFI